jgi:tripeptidyl-peptidase I
VPSGWSEWSSQPSSNTKLRLHVSVAYQNIDSLESRLAAVSTPGSPHYGQYIDVEEQNAIFGPSNSSLTKVVSWVQSSGGSSISVDSKNGVVSFTSTLANANSMLGADYKVYRTFRS